MAMGCGRGGGVARVLGTRVGWENQEMFCKGGEKFDKQKQQQKYQSNYLVTLVNTFKTDS